RLLADQRATHVGLSPEVQVRGFGTFIATGSGSRVYAAPTASGACATSVGSAASGAGAVRRTRLTGRKAGAMQVRRGPWETGWAERSGFLRGAEQAKLKRAGRVPGTCTRPLLACSPLMPVPRL